MALEAISALPTSKLDANQVSVEALDNIAMISLSTPKGEESNTSKALKKALGVSWPEIGKSSTANGVQALGMQIDQSFILLPYDDAWSAKKAQDAIGDAGYTTDQSDGWIYIRASGPRVKDALERICKLNLSDDTFGVGCVARTSMEHLGAIIYRESEDSYLLLSARSSALSFWDAITTSAKNLL